MVYAEEIEGAVLGACLLERSAQAVVLKLSLIHISEPTRP